MKNLFILLAFGLLFSTCKQDDPRPSLKALNLTTVYPYDEIQISGNNLGSATKVKFGTTQVVTPLEIAETYIIAQVPLLNPGNYSVTVVSPAGDSNPLSVTVLKPEPPSITNAKLKAFWNTELTIQGKNMYDVSAVNFGSTKVIPKETSDNYIVVNVPNIGGNQTIQLNVESFAGKSNTVELTGANPPVISQQIPTQPYAGFLFYLKGSNLSLIKGIRIGNTVIKNSDLLNYNSSEISFILPANVSAGANVMTFTTDYNEIKKSVTIASTSGNPSVNPGNISTNPGNVGSIGVVNDVCGSMSIFLYIDGVCRSLTGGKEQLGGSNNCPGPVYRNFNGRSFKTFADGSYEIMYEVTTSDAYTGFVMLADVNNGFSITHTGMVLKSGAFDSNKYASVITLISLANGGIKKICSPKIPNAGPSGSFQNGSYSEGGGKSCEQLVTCTTCKECN